MSRSSYLAIPDDFWNSIETSEEEYQDQPPGTFAVAQSLRAGKAQYKTRTGAQRAIPKSLIINDFSNWNQLPRLEKLRKQFVLHMLLKAGFELLVLQQGRLASLTHTNISVHLTSNVLGNANEEHLLAIAGHQLRLPHDQMLVLNEERMQALLTNQKGNKTWIALSDQHLNSYEFRRLQAEHPEITLAAVPGVYDSEQFYDADEIEVLTEGIFDSVSIGSDRSSGASALHDEINQLTKLKELTFKNSPRMLIQTGNVNNYPGDYEKIVYLGSIAEKIEFDVHHQLGNCGTYLETVIQKRKEPLKKMRITSVLQSDLFDNATKIFRVSSLEELQLDNIFVNQARFVFNMPELHTLKISYWDQDHENIEFESLQKLKIAKMANSLLSHRLLTAISNSNIESLELTNTNFQIKPEEIRVFSKLKSILISYCKNQEPQLAHLNALFSNSPDLERLEIYSSWIFDGDQVPFPSKPMLSLRRIVISDSIISTDQFISLLKNAPNLTEVVINKPNIDYLDLQDEELLRLLSTVEYSVSGDFVSNAPSRTAGGNRRKRAVNTRGVSAEHALDANTKNDPNRTLLHTKRFRSKGFFSTSHDKERITFYRMQVFDDFAANPEVCRPDSAFRLKQSDISEALNANIKDHTKLMLSQKELDTFFDRVKDTGKQKHYRADFKVQLGQAWIALPSLSSEDDLKRMALDGCLSNDIEIAYSQKFNLYYIRKKTPGEQLVTVNYVITAPSELTTPKQKRLPEEVQRIVNTCRAFGGSYIGEELQVSENATGQDYLNALLDQKMGACRHRALAFMEYAKRADIGYDMRYVNSDVHAYIEIKIDDEWITLDLGGAQVRSEFINQANDIAVSRPVLEPVKPPVAPIPSMSATQTTASVPSDNDDRASIPDAESSVSFPSTQPQTITPISASDELNHYLSTCIDNPQKKYLIRTDNADDLKGLAYHLQKKCIAEGRPYFYAHNPNDLICSAPCVLPDASDSTQTRGVISDRGTPLHRFLENQKNHTGLAPLLIVNFDQFKSADFVKYNSIVDKARKIDGVDLPLNFSIVGLINPDKPGAYQDSSFYSRFGNAIGDCPISGEALSIPKPFLEEEKSFSAVESRIVFNCHKNPDWKDYFLGTWYLDGSALHFRKGFLLEEMARLNITHLSDIELKNPPNTAEFTRFWEEAKLKGYIEFEGFRINVSPDCRIFCTKATLSVNENLRTVTNTKPPYSAFVLNETLFSEFLFHDEFSDNHTLSRKLGILERHKNQTISVFLSDALEEHTWSWFLEESKKHNVTIDLHVAPNVKLPDVIPKPTEARLEQGRVNDKTVYIQTNDRDAMCEILKEEHTPTTGEVAVIDISEMSANDLLFYCDGNYNQGDKTFAFTKKIAIVEKLLSEDKTIILHGNFSVNLQHELTRYIFDRNHNENARGKLIFVSEKPTTLAHCVEKKEERKIGIDQKKELLKKIFLLDETYFNDTRLGQYSYTQLCAMARRLEIKVMLTAQQENHEPALESTADISSVSPDFSHDRNRRSRRSRQSQSLLRTHEASHFSVGSALGFNERASIAVHRGMISGVSAPNYNYEDLQSSAEKVKQFNNKRLAAVDAVLENSCFAFIGGMSGIGKTTFINTVYKEKYSALHFGEDSIEKWAKDESVGRKTLFIDEANITAKQWSEFEGLMQKPPFIVIKGEKIQLTPEHKIIFAGNPVSYSDDRSLPDFFARHGNAVWFQPLPPAYLYREIILPVFGSYLESNHDSPDAFTVVESIAQPILKVAEFLTNISKDEVLITPRELAMMAALTIEYLKKHPLTSPKTVSAFYARQLAENFVSAKHVDSFNKKFPAVHLKRENLELKPQSDKEPFILTDANKPIAFMLNDFLSLRATRMEQSTILSERERTAGLGGMTIEGEPGLGKSELVIQLLHSHQLREFDIDDPAFDSKIHFVKASPTWSNDEKKKYLQAAFHKGAVVVWDEINSSSSMERLLNNLLMGKDENNKTATNPGFLLIGTQNPASMAGRRNTSPALLHRMHYRVLSPYNEKEMLDIIWGRRVSSDTAKALINTYQTDREAIPTKRKPRPCFRDLIARSDKEAKEPAVAALYAIEKKSASPNPVFFTGEIAQMGEYAQLKLAENMSATPQDLQVLAANAKSDAVLLRIDGRSHNLQTQIAIAQKTKDVGLIRKAIDLQLKENVATLDFSRMRLVDINLRGLNFKKIKEINVTGATLTTSQVNYLMKFTNDFSNITIVDDGKKINYKNGLNFTNADLRNTEFDSFESYKKNAFTNAKINNQQFFHMCAGKLMDTIAKTDYSNVTPKNLSYLDISKLDLTKLVINNDTRLIQTEMTEEQRVYLTRKRVNVEQKSVAGTGIFGLASANPLEAPLIPEESSPAPAPSTKREN